MIRGIAVFALVVSVAVIPLIVQNEQFKSNSSLSLPFPENIICRKSMFSEINRSIDNGDEKHSAKKSTGSKSALKQTVPEQESAERRSVAVATHQTRDSAHVSTSAPKHITVIDNKCPIYLRYPTFTHPKECFNHNITVLPCRSLRKHPTPSPYILETGVVFYVYSGNQCEGSNRYLIQVLTNARAIKEKDPSANIALITNCDVPYVTAMFLDVIVPVHQNDIIHNNKKQWFTRVLYNAYLPFHYSFILDTHVFPCYNTSYSEIFKLFKESGVDVSLSNRMNVYSISGGAVLSKWGKGSHAFWMKCVSWMWWWHHYDDQWAILKALKSPSKKWVFRKMSSNWFFASHGVSSTGVFKGEENCYRSSVVVTGPVQWIHGDPSECQLMNGEHNEHIYKNRAYFICKECKCAFRNRTIATSKEELQSFVSPNRAPKLLWNSSPKRSTVSLFWSYSCLF